VSRWLAVAALAVSSGAWANATGIAGYSGVDQLTCRECHEGNARADARFSGRRVLKPGETCDYALTVSGVGGWYAGIDVAAEHKGVKLAARDSTRVLGGEVVQLVARSLRDGPVSFRFGVTAPDEPGQYRLFGSALVADGNSRETGDAVADATYLVTVDAAADDPTPCALPGLAPPPTTPGVLKGPVPQLPAPMMMQESHARRTSLAALAVVFLLTGVALVRIGKSD
jgi:hypothetical protein